ncbi:MAG: metallophosphoesterase family protein [Candidatus Omnitrophota bacterium]
MKIVVISDTHIPFKAIALPEKLVEEIKGADMLIHAGDMVSLGFLNELKSIAKCLKAVYGNMDPEEVRKVLPQKEIFKAGNFKIGVFHGCGSPNTIFELLDSEFKDDKPDIIVFGHTHQAFNEKRSGALFFNPGSATDKACAECNTYGIIEINDKIRSKILKV